MSDYNNKFTEYRKTLSSKEWFLEEQSDAWKATENFVGHHFFNTIHGNIVFVGLFLLGLLLGVISARAGNDLSFWESALLVLIFLAVLSLAIWFKKYMATVIFHSYVSHQVTRKACLEKIDSYEYKLTDKLDGLARIIKFDANELRQYFPNDVEKIKHILEGLTDFSEELQYTQRELSALRDQRKEYYQDDLYDFAITNAVIEHHK